VETSAGIEIFVVTFYLDADSDDESDKDDYNLLKKKHTLLCRCQLPV
jgi:hypothetical protein